MIRRKVRLPRRVKSIGAHTSLAGTDAGASRNAYPRPLLQRDEWTNLNGHWEFCLDREAVWTRPEQPTFDQRIVVPFAPETPASGVNHTGHFRACWYRRTFDTPRLQGGQRLWLRFGAVDYEASVWVNGRLAVRHEGGYTPFGADITELLIDGPQQTIVVCAYDDPLDVSKPRGKQDWQEEPHGIWYYRTTGIWQTVWLERVPATHIESVRWSADLSRWQLTLTAQLHGVIRRDLKLQVRLTHEGLTLADDSYHIEHNRVQRTISLGDLLVQDARHRLQWTPDRPALIDAEVRLVTADGTAVDHARSYAAMREVSISPDGLLLNHQPCYLRLALDQGYWPESGLSAPDDGAYRRDIELLKSMGFNGVRKHQKIEDPQFLYWADRLGLVVWEEMPSAYRFSDRTMQRLTTQWAEVIQRDASHPCIVAWVPFNESWAVPDLPTRADQRAFVLALYHLTKALDATRPVVSNDGWENLSTDLVTVHDYAADPQRLIERYGGDREALRQHLNTTGPHGRVLTLAPFKLDQQPILLTEFGGIGLSKEKRAWGYTRAHSSEELAALYGNLLAHVRRLPQVKGFCYTQFTDTYQEANGLVYMDRTPKFAVEQIAAATRGPQAPEEHRWEAQWLKQAGAMRDRSPGITRRKPSRV